MSVRQKKKNAQKGSARKKIKSHYGPLDWSPDVLFIASMLQKMKMLLIQRRASSII